MRRTILLAVSVCLFVRAGLCQSSVTISSDPSDLSRPISTLIDQIRERQKLPVTYEDPRYSNSADIEDVTAEVARDPAEAERSGHRTLVPKGKAISFVYAPKDFSSSQQAEAALARMLHEYRMLGGPTFRVVSEGIRLHVVPVDVLDAGDNRTRQGSILDTVVSVPSGPRDGGELLQAICDAVKKQTGYEVGVGRAPSNYLAQYRTTEGIDGMSAQSAIERVLDKSSRPGSFVWDLYYDPGDKAYMLNFAYVGPAGPAAVPR
jgi:hypothetical protein